MRAAVCVCVCVCGSESKYEKDRVCDRESERGSESKCALERARECVRAIVGYDASVYKRERECLCVRESAKERNRERQCEKE